jgi:hypothetical protein
MAEPRDRKSRDRTFRRLEERDAPHAPPPVAWALGLGLGLLAGLVAGAADLAVSARAGIEGLPSLDLPSIGPWLVGHAALGAAIGLLGGATGLVGPRWATASVVTLGGWLAAPWGIAALGPRGVPAPAALGLGVLVAAALGQVAGRVPVPARVHQAGAALAFGAALALAPLHGRLLSSSTTPGALAASAAVVLLVAPIAAALAWFARDGRPPVVPIVAFGAVAVGGAVVERAGPSPSPAGVAGPSIVVVAVDGMGAGEAAAWPSLRGLERRATVYDHAVSPSGGAVPALGSVLTGLAPERHAAGRPSRPPPGWLPLDPRAVTVAAALADRGYATLGVTADPSLRASGLDAGFQRWDDAPSGVSAPVAAGPLRAAGLLPAVFAGARPTALVAERAIEHLRARAGAATLLLVHLPARGDGAPAALDPSLRALFEAVPEDAWLVVFGTPAPAESAEATAPVPLAIRGPGAPRRVVPRPVPLADLAPTLLAIAERGAPASAPPPAERPILAEVFGEEPPAVAASAPGWDGPPPLAAEIARITERFSWSRR